MESFILAALEAFGNANGDIDKFELLLRRAIMSQEVHTTTPMQTMLDSNFELTPEMAEELASMDLDNMSDDQIMNYAVKMGLVK